MLINYRPDSEAGEEANPSQFPLWSVTMEHLCIYAGAYQQTLEDGAHDHTVKQKYAK